MVAHLAESTFSPGRRKFLKNSLKTAAAVTSILAEQKFGVLERFLLELAKDKGEANIFQRAAKLDSITRAVVAGKADREVLAGFLQFNIAEAHFRNKGLRMPVIAMQHYLYGNGETLDISNIFFSDLAENANFSLGKNFSESERLGFNVSMLMSERSNAHTINFGKDNETPRFPINLLGNTDFLSDPNYNQHPAFVKGKTSFKGVVGSGYMASHLTEDTHYTLGRYTMDLEGNVFKSRPAYSYEEELALIPDQTSPLTSIVSCGDFPARRIDITSPRVTIYDRYDFDKVSGDTHYFSAEYSLALAMSSFGTALMGPKRYSEWHSDNIDFKTSQWLRDTSFGSFDYHNTGNLMEAGGFTKPFDITGNYKFPEDTVLSFYLSEKDIP